MLKLFLQRTRFNLRNLFAKKIVIPTNFKSFEYTNPNYHQLLASYLLSNTDEKINYSKKIKKTFTLQDINFFRKN